MNFSKYILPFIAGLAVGALAIWWMKREKPASNENPTPAPTTGGGDAGMGGSSDVLGDQTQNG